MILKVLIVTYYNTKPWHTSMRLITNALIWMTQKVLLFQPLEKCSYQLKKKTLKIQNKPLLSSLWLLLQLSY